MLIIVHHRDFISAFSLRSISKQVGADISSRFIPPKVGSSALTIVTNSSTVLAFTSKVKHINIGINLKQQALTLHYRLAGFGANIAQA
jgi:hypothetical protein